MKSKPRIKVVGACALVLGVCAGFVSLNASAACDAWHFWICDYGSHFISGGTPTRSVFCDRPEIRGEFDAKESRYASRGMCVQLEGNTPIIDDTVVGRSEFDDYSHAKEIFRAGWTAEAGYNAVTKEAWEKITFPAPTLDTRAPAGQPYGRFESKMICATDPWIELGARHCTAINGNATGSLGDIEKMLRLLSLPFTTNTKNTQALYNAHQAFLKRSAALAAVAKTTTQAQPALRSVTLPEIIEPRAGNAYPPQTPLKIRVKPPRDVKVQTYLVQIEVKQKSGDWLVQTNIPVSAAELEGVLGYKGWGWHQPGTGLQMTANAGIYRVRAHASFPDPGEAGEWHEFIIAGEPGAAPDRLQTGKVVTRAGLGNAAPDTGAAAAAMGSALAKSPAETTKEGSLQTPRVLVPQKGALDWSKASAGASTLQALPRSQP